MKRTMLKRTRLQIMQWVCEASDTHWSLEGILSGITNGELPLVTMEAESLKDDDIRVSSGEGSAK